MVVLGGVSLWKAFLWWNVILLLASFFFGVIGLNAAHHHPELFHDGDEPRDKDLDWGLAQIDTVRDRVEIKGNVPLTLVLFGEHCLHHLFPTVDHAHLHKLYPLLEETLDEFGVEYKMGSIWDLIRGQFLQLARNHSVSFKKTQ
ncbi:cytochrome b5-related protein-like [Cimex lectularius]|uniref:Fatty acid desaturase domain-containing protein n=1 Tax=Cimex lectularius TaxID=79782 RepID=A0A8I6STD2_CIMLE|nr:cytochrome b5-related protein-like [Cimex lectularius]